MQAPDPERARTIDELIAELRMLKASAGNPSITTITKRIHDAWQAAGTPESEWPARATVGDCFRLGRSRPNADLVLAVVQALVGDNRQALIRWRHSLSVVLGEREAAAWVSVQDRLPGDIPEFTGRAELLRQVIEMTDTGPSGTAMVISALDGMAGVGKTTLAVHLGHRILAKRDRTVLFVNLRGFDAEGPPADPFAVLEAFLRLIGVPGEAIPKTLDGRAGLYRQRLAGTDALVVLDNALDDRQVEPLLPRSSTSLTLITSRNTLQNLDDAIRLSLQVFTTGEALDLLSHTAGSERIGADLPVAARIAELLGCLPLALSIIGKHLRGHLDWTLADYLPPLTALAMEGGVQAALALSDQGLSAELRRLLRLLALQPGEDFDRGAAAALAGQDLDSINRQLHALVSAHLLTQPALDRYGWHDLVRTYAAERARLDEPQSRIRHAQTRLLDHYRYSAAVAMDLVYPYEQSRRPEIAAPATPAFPPRTADLARGWLDAEEANLVAVATQPGRPRHTADIAMLLWRHLHVTGHTTVALTLHERALIAARDLRDPASEVHVLNHLGGAYWKYGRIAEALQHFQHALTIARRVGDRASECRALNNIGIVYERQRRLTEALEHYQQSLDIAGELGDLASQGRAENNLGTICIALGRSAEALDHLHRALPIAREIGDRANEAYVLNNIGNVLRRQRRCPEALRHFQQALSIGEELDDQEFVSHALTNIGAIHRYLGRPALSADCHRRALGIARAIGSRITEGFTLTNVGLLLEQELRLTEAIEHHRQALAIAREIGDRYVEIEALNNLGRALSRAGSPGEAIDVHQVALTLAVEAAERYEQARAHTGLAIAHQTRDGLDEALAHRGRARALYNELDLPDPDESRSYPDTEHQTDCNEPSRSSGHKPGQR